MPAIKPENIDAYIAGFSPEVQHRLKQIRSFIRDAAPEAEELISYAIPTFRLKGNLVHFAAFRHHIGFYPGPTGIAEFKEALSLYRQGRGSVQFPYDQPLPEKLIREIVCFRVKENLAKKK